MTMVSSTVFIITALILSLLFFGAILLCVEAGWRLAARHSKLTGDRPMEGTKAIEAALFGLLGLLLAFTFSGALTRFDSRRLLVIDETNKIGTAYLRLDLLPSASRLEVKKLMRDYLDLRIEAYRNISNPSVWSDRLTAAQLLQAKIWDNVIAAIGKDKIQPVAVVILPALNEMFDITTTRTMWTQMHPPLIIFALLVGIGLACSVVAGYSLFRDGIRRWLHIVGFAFVLAFTFYVILDIEFPRRGFLRVDGFDKAMVDLRASMK